MFAPAAVGHHGSNAALGIELIDVGEAITSISRNQQRRSSAQVVGGSRERVWIKLGLVLVSRYQEVGQQGVGEVIDYGDVEKPYPRLLAGAVNIRVNPHPGVHVTIEPPMTAG